MEQQGGGTGHAEIHALWKTAGGCVCWFHVPRGQGKWQSQGEVYYSSSGVKGSLLLKFVYLLFHGKLIYKNHRVVVFFLALF